MFETLESAFWWVAVGPLPLTVHPRGFTDLPERALSLYQLRVRLASPTVSAASRCAIWSYLVRQARTQGRRQPDWTIAAAGLALPDLVRIVATLYHRHPATNPHNRPDTGQSRVVCSVADLEAAALGGFYTELRRTDLNNTRDPRIRRLMLSAAYRAARTLRDTQPPTTDPTEPTEDTTGQATTRPASDSHSSYPRALTRLAQARRDARQAHLARHRAGRSRLGQVRP